VIIQDRGTTEWMFHQRSSHTHTKGHLVSREITAFLYVCLYSVVSLLPSLSLHTLNLTSNWPDRIARTSDLINSVSFSFLGRIIFQTRNVTALLHLSLLIKTIKETKFMYFSYYMLRRVASLLYSFMRNRFNQMKRI